MSKPSAAEVIEFLKTNFEGIEFLDAEFHLHGYMIHRKIKKHYHWNGRTDVIGWYDNHWVIVDWKTSSSIENFWGINTYKQYLHQCLVYSRLLQLHLDNLAELPQILIVAIDTSDAKKISAGLFSEFPEECKNKLQEYDWLRELDEPTRSIRSLNIPKNLVEVGIEVGTVDENEKLLKVFNDTCKVKDLLAVLHVFNDTCKVKDLLPVLHVFNDTCKLKDLLAVLKFDELKVY